VSYSYGLYETPKFGGDTPKDTSDVPSHVRAFAPGRVNLLGEHTDYNQGLSLPFAIADGVTVTAEALREPVIEAVALDLDAEDGFPLACPEPAKGWRAFVRGAVGELAGAGV